MFQYLDDSRGGGWRGARGRRGGKKLIKHPFSYQNTDIGWTWTHILTLDFIILCLLSGSRLRSPVTLEVSRCQSHGYFVDCKGIFTPHTLYLGSKKYPSFTNHGHAELLKKTPSSVKYLKWVRPHSVPDSPPPPPPDRVLIVSRVHSGSGEGTGPSIKDWANWLHHLIRQVLREGSSLACLWSSLIWHLASNWIFGPGGPYALSLFLSTWWTKDCSFYSKTLISTFHLNFYSNICLDRWQRWQLQWTAT